MSVRPSTWAWPWLVSLVLPLTSSPRMPPSTSHRDVCICYRFPWCCNRDSVTGQCHVKSSNSDSTRKANIGTSSRRQSQPGLKQSPGLYCAASTALQRVGLGAGVGAAANLGYKRTRCTARERVHTHAPLNHNSIENGLHYVFGLNVATAIHRVTRNNERVYIYIYMAARGLSVAK